MNKKYILFLFLLSFLYRTSAQNQLMGKYQNNATYILNSEYGRLTNDNSTTRYFQTLATYTNKTNPELVCGLNIQARIIGVNTGSYKLQVYIKGNIDGGDTTFRNIGLGYAIIPDFFSFDFTISDLQSKLLRRFEHRLVPVNWNDAVIDRNYNDTLSFVNCSPSIINLKVHYSQNQTNQLGLRIAKINAYYAVDFTNYNQRLDAMRPDEVDSLESYRKFIGQCQEFQKQLNAQKYITELNLNQQDPARYIIRYNDFSYLLESRNKQVSDNYGKFRDLLYQKGQTYMNTDLNKAESYFRKAVGNTFNNHHAAYMMLARINLLKNQPDSATDKINLLYGRIADDKLRGECKDLGKDIFDKYILYANTFIDDRKYKEALSSNSKARDLCNQMDFGNCLSACDHIQIKAWQGKYKYLIDEAKKAFDKKDWDAAEEFAEDAARTQRNNPKEITKDGDPEAILLNIYKQRYIQYINLGTVQLKAGNNQLATNYFDKALEMEYKGVSTNSSLIGLRQKAAKPLLLQALDSVSATVSGNLIKARKSFDVVQKRIDFYVLTTDLDIQKRSDKLKAQIYTQECTNAENDFNKMMGTARQLISELRYVDADTVLTSAIAHAGIFSRCGVRPDRAQKEQSDIAAAAKFQRRMLHVNDILLAGKYEEVTSEYRDILLFFKENNLGEKKLTALEYPEWAYKQANAPFILYVSNLMRSEGNPQIAWKLLGRAMDLGIPPKNTKVLQTLLGTDIANQRHSYFSDGKEKPVRPEVDVLNYTNGNKRWKVFKKAFIKQAKTLKKG